MFSSSAPLRLCGECLKRLAGIAYLLFLCTLGGPIDALWYRWKFGRWPGSVGRRCRGAHYSPPQ